MKFLIQKMHGKIEHDFSITLLKSIEYQKWIQNDQKVITVKFLDFYDKDKWEFRGFHKNYVPIGSVEFVRAWFETFHNHTPKPMNVPEELFGYCNREIFNGTEKDLSGMYGKLFVKDNDKIKGIAGIFNHQEKYVFPKGNYQISEFIEIIGEWRAFVYYGELVGLQNYNGDFTRFPNILTIRKMINRYKSAPKAYTLDVGIGTPILEIDGNFITDNTFVIECHDFFSCGLYGFADHRILPYMFYRWHHEYLNKNKLIVTFFI